MRRGYIFKLREYIRYFVLGVIVAALALGNMAIRATHPDVQRCKPWITYECPNKTKPYEEYPPVCPQIITPCPLEKSEQGTTQ